MKIRVKQWTTFFIIFLLYTVHLRILFHLNSSYNFLLSIYNPNICSIQHSQLFFHILIPDLLTQLVKAWYTIYQMTTMPLFYVQKVFRLINGQWCQNTTGIFMACFIFWYMCMNVFSPRWKRWLKANNLIIIFPFPFRYKLNAEFKDIT